MTWAAGPPEPLQVGPGWCWSLCSQGSWPSSEPGLLFPWAALQLWPLHQPGCCEWCQSYQVISSGTMSARVCLHRYPLCKSPLLLSGGFPSGFSCVRVSPSSHLLGQSLHFRMVAQASLAGWGSGRWGCGAGAGVAVALLTGPRAQGPHFSPAASMHQGGRFGSEASGIREGAPHSILHIWSWMEQDGAGGQRSLWTGPG